MHRLLVPVNIPSGRAIEAASSAVDCVQRSAYTRQRPGRTSGTLFTVGVSDHMMVAHSLRGAPFGPAQRLHGATYEVRIELRAAKLDADGIVADIGALRGALRDTLAPLEYRNLD